MIDIDLTEPIGEIRANIGDPQEEFVTNATLISALAKCEGNILNASIIVMQMMLTAFSTLADRERAGQVEIYYTQLYERYKKQFDDLKKKLGYKKAVPIYIGGTSLKAKNTAVESLDAFSMYQLPDWHDIQLGNKTLVEQEAYRLTL